MSNAVPPAKAPDPGPTPGRLEAFRDEARGLLASAGGLTAQGLARVRHRATELELSPTEFDAVLKGLGGESIASDQAASAAFGRAADGAFAKYKYRPGDVLDPNRAAQLAQHGRETFGLSADRAKSIVAEAAHRNGILLMTVTAVLDAVKAQAPHPPQNRCTRPRPPYRFLRLRHTNGPLPQEGQKHPRSGVKARFCRSR